MFNKTIVTKAHNACLIMLLMNSFLIAHANQPQTASKNANTQVDTSGWQCEYCPKSSGADIELTLATAWLSNKNYRFSHLNGFDDKANILLSGSVDYQNDEGQYLRFNLQNALLDSLYSQLLFGEYGRYKIAFNYQELPIRQQNGLVSPYQMISYQQLVLPDNWQLLTGTENQINSQQWQRYQTGADWQKMKLTMQYQSPSLFDYHLKVQRIEKSGIKEFSAAQLLNATYLPLPFDQQIDQLNTNVSYQGNNWQASLGYQLSVFENTYDALTYQIPYLAYPNGDAFNQLATEPDNSAYKVNFDINYQFLSQSWMKFHAATGQMKQESSLLTGNVLATSIPLADVNATTDTKDVSLRLYSRIDNSFALRGNYQFHQQDNNSEQLSIIPIVLDGFSSNEITSPQYDYRRNKLTLAGYWRFSDNQRASIELRQDKYRRSDTRVEQTNNKGISANLGLHDNNDLQLNISASYFKRDAEQFHAIDPLNIKENPLMRRYNLADRKEQKLSFFITRSYGDNISGTFSANLTNHDYQENTLGMQKNHQLDYGIDINWFQDNTNLAIFYHRDRVNSNFNVNQGLYSLDWTGNSHDKVTTFGLELAAKKLWQDRGKLSLSAVTADGNSDYGISGSRFNTVFPSINSRWTHFELSVNYQLSTQWRTKLSLQLDKFNSDDYALSNESPLAASNLITLAASSYNYHLDYALLSFTYEFPN